MSNACRYFLGVDLAFREQIASYVKRLKPSVDIKWQVPGKWHLTLCFLGNDCPQHLLKDQKLAVGGCSVFTQATCVFDKKRNSILSMDCHNNQLLSWRSEVLGVLSLEDDGWYPHITLGRGRPSILKAAIFPPVAMSFTVQELHLFESNADTRHQYKKISTYALEK